MCKIVITTLVSLFFSLSAFGMKVFDMKEIRDPSTLQIRVLQDWHKLQGPIATQQRLVSVNVGDLWLGQEYRVQPPLLPHVFRPTRVSETFPPEANS